MKRVAALALVILACAQSILPLASGSADSLRGPPVELFGDWNINNVNLTHDCTLILSGNLTVTGPGYLELSNVTLKMNSSFGGQYRISVINGGRLALVNNTIITRNAGFNYSFSASSASQLWVNESCISWCGFRQPAMGDWSPGIFINNSRADIRGALLTSNFAALNAINSNVTFNRTSALNNDFGVSLNRSSISLRDSDINSTVLGAGPDFRLNGSNAELVNSTCRWNEVLFLDPGSGMNVSWPAAARAFFLDGPAASGVNVSFSDRQSNERARVTSDAQGWARTVLRELARNQTATLMDAPYTASTEWHGISKNSTGPFDVNGSVTVGIGVDRIPPVLGFTFPDSEYVNQTGLELRGTASDDQAVVSVELSLDGTGWTPAADTGGGAPWSTWNCSMDLLEGANIVRARAVDAAGLANQTSLQVSVDTVSPVIVIFSPAPGCTTNAGSMTVSGRTEPDAAVAVNQVPASTSDGFFNASVPLRVGWNSIEVTAVDRAGNMGHSVLEVLRDVAPPNLTVHSPAGDFLTNQSTVLVTGLADADASVFVDGAPDPLPLGPGGNFSVTVNLTQGGNTIDIRARDQAGNEALVSVKGVMDSIAPQLDAWASATLTNQSQILLSGKTEPGSNVIVAGNHTAVGPFGDFSGWVDLAQGLNRIPVSSGDIAGNRNLAVVEVFRDVIPPNVSISRPVNREVLNRTDVEVDGTAEDASGIAGVEVGVDDRNYTFCNGTTSWRGTISISAGNHTVQAIAYDRAGNSHRVELNVTCSPVIKDRDPPSIVVLYPVAAEVTASSIRFRGLVSDPSGVANVELSADGASWRPCPLDTKNGSWQADIVLHLGANRIFIRATDTLGNNGTRTIDVSYVPSPNRAGPDIGAVVVPAAALVAAVVVVVLMFLQWRRWKDQPEPGLGEDEALMGFPGKGFK